MTSNYGRGLYKEYELLLTENEIIKAKHEMLKKEHAILQVALKRQETLECELEKKASEIEALKKEILRLNGYLNTDGTNSGLPTSKTPLSKKKVIPNSRTKNGKKVGGQPGHAKSKLKAFADDEVSEIKKHELNTCPYCGSWVEDSKKTIDKDELDYEVVVRKIRHQFNIYNCANCGHDMHAPIPKELKEENQYGSHVKALGLSLMNIGNVSVNKVRKMIYGLSEEQINPTEGYLMKQQKNAAKALEDFIKELKEKCLELDTLYWDDTVININTKRGCLRFYGNERYALYCAHRYKNKDGLDDDGILKLLPTQTVVMHDHNRVNYNKEYSFINIECNVHLLRDLQKTTDNLQHQWSADLKELLEKTNTQRNELIKRADTAFTAEEVKAFFERFDQTMLLAAEENRKDFNKYYGRDEQTLILRILDYKDNYLAWVVNFNLPFSNNLSERALRGAKSKQKISGQFQTEETAGYYATVKSYIETCYRNGINETEALVRLCSGDPYTIKEIFSNDGDS